MVDYDVIKVPAGQRRVINIDSGETFENKLIDITAKGAEACIAAMGTNWTVRNVGFKGTFDGTGRAFGVGDTGGGESLIENVYIGDGTDGSVGSTREPGLGLWVTPEHSGHLTIDGMNVQEAYDNGIYASAPGSNSNGKRGTVDIVNCYGKNNRVAHFRTAGGRVENCVAVNDGNPSGRCVWGWPTRGSEGIVVRDCDFICGNYPHGYDFGQSGKTTTATVIDTDYSPRMSTRKQGNLQLRERNVGHNPVERIPEGCPTSAEEAASGGDEAGSRPRRGHGKEHEITFEGDGKYFFETEGGEIDTLTDGHANPNGHRTVGELNDSEITFAYDTYLADIGVTDGVTARINGEHEPTWSMYPADSSGGRSWLSETVWGGDEPDDGDSSRVEDLLEEIERLEHEVAALKNERDELSVRVEEAEREADQYEEDLSWLAATYEKIGGRLKKYR